MKLPRDLSGTRLAGLLARLGYAVDHQTGSHIRLTTQVRGEHHVTIPAHGSLGPGTLNAVLKDVAEHHGMDREALMRELWG